MKKLLILVSLVLIISTAVALWWINNDMQGQLNNPISLPDNSVLLIKPGQSLKSLGKELVERGWLSHPHYFIYEGRRQKIASALKQGEYTITEGTTPLQLLDILVAGKVRQYSMTIPEGWTFRQILQAVKDKPELIQSLNTDNSAKVMAELGYPGYLAEGRVYPDTYHFPAGTSDVEFLRRAIQTQERVLQEEWQQRQSTLPYQSPYEALIMASIIEKETGLAEERGQIAGVFVRRLQRKMKLQTDPTVIYAMAESFDGDIRRKDLSIDSPYNTYVYKGLPPTPIASPGREAIRAALQPESGSSLYFVAKGDGSHYFSDTLKEHNKAVTRYQLRRR
jgi:peptidoglycan lytic transglycosylase G